MANRQFTLTEQQVAELNRAYDASKDGPTRTRYQAARLYGTGYPVTAITEITGCSRPALMVWCRNYREHGVAGLVDKRKGGNHRSLTPAQVVELGSRLHQYTPRDLFRDGNPFWTAAKLQHAVLHWYGVSYRSLTSYYTLFHRLGFSRPRPAKTYKSRREMAVRDFEEQVEKNCWIPSNVPQRP